MDLRNISEILTLLDHNEVLAAKSINMVPSENSMSSLAKLPLMLDVYHRYFFNDKEMADQWNFRGAQQVAKLETQLAIPLLQELTGAEFVNLRPLSGLSGMLLVLAALGGKAGSTVMTVAPDQGGHYATASVATRLGLKTTFITGPDAHTIDYNKFETTLRKQRPTLIYLDQSNCLFPIDIEQISAITRKVSPNTLIHVDASHWMGLVLGGQMPNPLFSGADSFSGSMHKTFPGPQKAIFATLRPDLAEQVHMTQFYMISSHHFGATISLALALLEFKECGGTQYAESVVHNTKEFARCLHKHNLDVEGADRGFSCGHQIWIRTSTAGVDAFTASDRLYKAGIRVNVLTDLPRIAEPALRIGVNEATYRGLQVEDMAELAAIFVAAVKNLEPLHELSEHVSKLRDRYRFPYSFPSDEPHLLSQILQLVVRVMVPGSSVDDAKLLAILESIQRG